MSPFKKLPKLAAVAACVGGLALAVPGVASAAGITFFAVLNSGQEMQTTKPTSNALGTALATLDIPTRMLCYAISYTALEGGAELAAHFHGPASAGQNAAVLFTISPSPSALDSPKSGCVGPLTPKNVSDLKKGLFYINVHSTNFPDGEIRGQVLRSTGAITRGSVSP